MYLLQPPAAPLRTVQPEAGQAHTPDIGQMQMYVHYYDCEVRLIDKNPIIGILLCQDKNDAVMKMMLLANNE